MIRGRQVRGRQVVTTVVPTEPPPGSLEQAAWLLLHHAAPLDPAVQQDVARRWHLEPLTPRMRSEGVGGPWPSRRPQDLLARLRRLAAGCRPPVSLVQAVRLLRDAPWLTQRQAAAFLRIAGLCQLDDPVPLVRGLAAAWSLGDPLRPAAGREAVLARLARQVRGAGALDAEGVPSAADALWLREHGRVEAAPGHLVAAEDVRSRLARPVRRQLAAVGGALPVGEVLVGCLRERPALRAVGVAGLTAWARYQPDLTLTGDRLALAGGHGRWLGTADLAVLALFAGGGPVGRPAILRTLQHGGLPLPSAHQWLTHCGWLRHAGARGRYTLPGAPA